MKSLCMLLAFCLIGGSSTRIAHAGTPTIASSPEQSSSTGSGGSFAPALSGNGRVLVFPSAAKNLATNQYQSLALQLFRFDVLTGKSALISIKGNGPANADAASIAVSSNGESIVFASRAANLVAFDTNQ